VGTLPSRGPPPLLHPAPGQDGEACLVPRLLERPQSLRLDPRAVRFVRISCCRGLPIFAGCFSQFPQRPGPRLGPASNPAPCRIIKLEGPARRLKPDLRQTAAALAIVPRRAGLLRRFFFFPRRCRCTPRRGAPSTERDGRSTIGPLPESLSIQRPPPIGKFQGDRRGLRARDARLISSISASPGCVFDAGELQTRWPDRQLRLSSRNRGLLPVNDPRSAGTGVLPQARPRYRDRSLGDADPRFGFPASVFGKGLGTRCRRADCNVPASCPFAQRVRKRARTSSPPALPVEALRGPLEDVPTRGPPSLGKQPEIACPARFRWPCATQ